MPNGLGSLVELNLSGNQLTNLSLPPSLRSVGSLGLSNNRLTNAGFLANLTQLNSLDLENNRLLAFALPSWLTNLVFLSLGNNFLSTNFSLPNGLGRLGTERGGEEEDQAACSHIQVYVKVKSEK